MNIKLQVKMTIKTITFSATMDIFSIIDQNWHLSNSTAEIEKIDTNIRKPKMDHNGRVLLTGNNR